MQCQNITMDDERIQACLKVDIRLKQFNITWHEYRQHFGRFLLAYLDVSDSPLPVKTYANSSNYDKLQTIAITSEEICYSLSDGAFKGDFRENFNDETISRYIGYEDFADKALSIFVGYECNDIRANSPLCWERYVKKE